MSRERSAAERILAEVTSWAGVSARPGAGGKFVFSVAGREIGHLNGDPIDTESGVWEMIGLMRLNYSRALARLSQAEETRPGAEPTPASSGWAAVGTTEE